MYSYLHTLIHLYIHSHLHELTHSFISNIHISTHYPPSFTHKLTFSGGRESMCSPWRKANTVLGGTLPPGPQLKGVKEPCESWCWEADKQRANRGNRDVDERHKLNGFVVSAKAMWSFKGRFDRFLDGMGRCSRTMYYSGVATCRLTSFLWSFYIVEHFL